MDLTIEQIEIAAADMKEDLQRKANQGILRNDVNRAMVALAGMAHIDDFVYQLRIRSGSQLTNYAPRRRGRPREDEHPGQLPLPGTVGPIAAKKRRVS
jgi:hypothetical protein